MESVSLFPVVLPKYLQPKELGCFPKQPSFLQAEHRAMPGGSVTPAACSPALPSCRGAWWDRPEDVAGRDPNEIACSYEGALKGAALSNPHAASDVGSAQVREEQAWATGHLKCHPGTSESPWSSCFLWCCISFSCCDDSGQTRVTEGVSGTRK